MKKRPSEGAMAGILLKMAVLWLVLALFTGMLNKLNRQYRVEKKKALIEVLSEESMKEREPYIKQQQTLNKEQEEGKKDEPMDRYKRSVTWFCRYFALVTHIIDAAYQGREIERRKLVYAMSMMRQYKAYVLRDKRALGMEDDFDAFAVEQKFEGFELKGGRLIMDEKADPCVVENVARKWIKGFPGKYDAFHFEVGTLLMALDEPFLEEDFPAEWRRDYRLKKAS